MAANNGSGRAAALLRSPNWGWSRASSLILGLIYFSTRPGRSSASRASTPCSTDRPLRRPRPRRGGGDHLRRDRPLGRRGGRAVLGRLREADDPVAPRRRHRRPAPAVAIVAARGPDPADGPGDRAVPRLDDQPVPPARRSSPPWRRWPACGAWRRSSARTGDQRPASTLFRASAATPSTTFPTFAVVAVVVSVMMGATVLGRHLFALGGNEAAARLSGLKIRRLKAFAYGLSGRPLRARRHPLRRPDRPGRARSWGSPTSSSRSPPPSSAGAAWPAASARSGGPCSAWS